jgi:hypothetical protein
MGREAKQGLRNSRQTLLPGRTYSSEIFLMPFALLYLRDDSRMQIEARSSHSIFYSCHLKSTRKALRTRRVSSILPFAAHFYLLLPCHYLLAFCCAFLRSYFTFARALPTLVMHRLYTFFIYICHTNCWCIFSTTLWLFFDRTTRFNCTFIYISGLRTRVPTLAPRP